MEPRAKKKMASLHGLFLPDHSFMLWRFSSCTGAEGAAAIVEAKEAAKTAVENLMLAMKVDASREKGRVE